MTMQIQAWTEDDINIVGVTAKTYCRTFADAERFVAGLPKAVRAKAIHLGGHPNYNALVEVNARFYADGVNGGKNEAGLKRLRMLLACVAWEYVATLGNAATLTQFADFVRTDDDCSRNLRPGQPCACPDCN